MRRGLHPAYRHPLLDHRLARFHQHPKPARDRARRAAPTFGRRPGDQPHAASGTTARATAPCGGPFPPRAPVSDPVTDADARSQHAGAHGHKHTAAAAPPPPGQPSPWSGTGASDRAPRTPRVTPPRALRQVFTPLRGQPISTVRRLVASTSVSARGRSIAHRRVMLLVLAGAQSTPPPWNGRHLDGLPHLPADLAWHQPRVSGWRQRGV